MPRITRIALGLFLVGAISLLLLQCNSLDRVTAAEFESALERSNQAESAHAFTPIGVTAGRAYIEHWSAVPILGSRVTVLWIPVTELSAGMLARITARN